MKKKSKILTFIIIIVIAGVALFCLHSKKATGKEFFYTVKSEMHDNVIEVSGNVEAAQQQVMQTKNDGTVKKVNVKVGDRVKTGQAIVELDASEQEYNLANHNYKMEQTSINGSKKELAVMKMQQKMLENKLSDRTITARFDGVVTDLNVDEGDYLNTDLAKDVGTIIDRSYLYAEVEVVENDASRLKIGQDVIFSFPSYPKLKVKGYVKFYPATGRITSRGATVLDVEIRIDNPPEEILPGFSFTAEIIVSEPELIVTVDSKAIGYDHGKAFAMVKKKDGSIQKCDVKVDKFTAGTVRILDGVKPGDKLLPQKEDSINNARMGGGPMGPMGGGPHR